MVGAALSLLSPPVPPLAVVVSRCCRLPPLLFLPLLLPLLPLPPLLLPASSL
ncbi:MAG: hypothetical protein IPG88_13185 [Gemmatimonadetes bacterium]|nr:hypothetical protein [Gemmatimonadota bacterium]